MSHHIVEAQKLSFKYPDSNRGVEDISFSIHHGESVAVIGENGAGKSTLLMQLNGFLQASSGTLRIGDVLVDKESLLSVRKTVGMVFQNSDDQLFMSTVYEDVAFGLRNLGVKESDIEEKVMKALERVGASHLKDRPPYRLSSGEKRAVAIATVLVMSPDILVMDEPSSNLDPKSRRRLIELLKSFSHTKIIATHDLDLALDLCERTLVLHEGKICADGKTEAIFKNEELLKRCSLEQPLSWRR